MPAQRKPLLLGSLTDHVGFHLRLAQLAVFKDFDRELAELGVSPAVFSVLEVLNQNPGLTQSRLAKAVRLDHSSVVPLLDKLGRRELVERRTSTTDRRHKHLYLTVAGTDLLRRAQQRASVHEVRICAPFTAREKKQLLDLLARFEG